MPESLYLLDGMALAYRAHFALIRNPIITSKGFNTSAIFGFTGTLIQLITKLQPTHLAVVFDTSEPTERHRIHPEYKAQREEMPEDLSAALPLPLLRHPLRPVLVFLFLLWMVTRPTILSVLWHIVPRKTVLTKSLW